MTSTLPDAVAPQLPPHPEALLLNPASHLEGPRTLGRRIFRGREADPVWVRPGVIALLTLTAALYLWNLGESGWANSFYSAAVQAGTQSWKAFFFGSFDSSNLITVDKPPASLWVMEISARIFGVNSWSILVPQALEGVASVGVLYLAVRRAWNPAAGLIAGAVLALTPIATLMFRFNNPDALLVLLLVLAAYAMMRAIEKVSTGWLILAATFVGFAFLTKMMQAFVIVPVFALVYLIVSDTPLRRRIWQLLLAGVALVLASGWWVLIVTLIPNSDRPYIGGSQKNSIMELILGYNGLGRLTGSETGSITPGGGGGAGGAGMWGETGWSRMFSSEYGGQIAWLIPAALIAFGAALWFTRRAPRTDITRAAVLLWGGWLIITGLTFSFAAGIIHPYYSVALAPAIGALVGIGSVMLWQHRDQASARVTLADAMAVTAGWAFVMLGRSTDWMPWLRMLVLVGGIAAAIALLFVTLLPRRAALVVAGAGLVVALAAPTAYSLNTAATSHTGSLPTAGPFVAVGRGMGGGPGGFAGGPQARLGHGQLGQGQIGQGQIGAPPGFGAPPGLGAQGQGALPPGTGGLGTGGLGTGGPQGAAGGGAGGGLLDASMPSSELTVLLSADASSYTWVAAAVGSQSAAGYQLATGEPVMSLGGFNGSDPAPTLAEFQTYVSNLHVHYFISGGGSGVGGMGGGGMGSNGGSSATSDISTWVAANFTAQTIGGVTIYDLTAPTTKGSALSGTNL